MLSGSGWMESAPIERWGFRRSRWPMDRWRAVVGRLLGHYQRSQRAGEGALHQLSFGSGDGGDMDPELVQREGQAIGQEVKALGGT